MPIWERNFVSKELNVYYVTWTQTRPEKQQIIQAQVQHDWTDDYIPEVICGVWLKYLLPVTLKGGSTEPLEPPLATGMCH